MKKMLLILFVLYSVATTVSAADPIQVSENIVIADVNIEKIWRWTGGFCTIRVWHPAVEKCSITREGGSEFRTLTLADGGEIKEQHTGGQVYGYDYTIVSGPLPVKDYQSSFRAEDVEGGVKFIWSATFLADGKPDTEAKATITGVFQGGLQAIAKRYKNKKNKKEGRHNKQQ